MTIKIIARLVVLTSILVSLLLQGCQTSSLVVQHYTSDAFDEGVYKSVAVQAVGQGGVDSLLVTKGFENGLIEKGYVLAEKPQILLAYKLLVTEGDQLKHGVATTGFQVYSVTELEAVYEAKLLVNAIDTNTGKVIWKASTVRDIRSLDKSKVDQTLVNERIAELLASFPEK